MLRQVARLRQSTQAFRDVFRNTSLRRLQLAWAGSTIATWAYGVALAVYAYTHDGAAAVGVVALIRLLAAAVAQPFAAALGDRYDRGRVMMSSAVARAALMAAAAVAVFGHSPSVVVYAIAGLVPIAGTPFRPAQASLTPALARSPEELTAANVVSSSIESVGIFAGPALGGLLLALSGTATVFVVTAGLVLWSAVVVSRVRDPGGRERAEPEPVRDELLAGARTIAHDGRLRLLIGLFSAQTFVDGMLNVLVVVIALRLLGSGAGAVGYLNSAAGVGGILGGVVAAALVGRKRLAGDFGVGLVVFGLPLALLAAWPSTALALLVLGLNGFGNTLIDVSGMTLLQRAAPEDVIARVFGVLETMFFATVGLGAVAAPALLALLGTRGALIATGALLPLLLIPSWPTLRAIDRAAAAPLERIALLREIPIFAPLPAATIERLASSLRTVTAAAGETIVQKGEPGDLFYVVASGEAEVVGDDMATVVLEPGSFFGEIALLRDVPRTATVRARTPLELYALGRDEFIPAVTGHAPSRDAADRVIGLRLAPAPAGLLRA